MNQQFNEDVLTYLSLLESADAFRARMEASTIKKLVEVFRAKIHSHISIEKLYQELVSLEREQLAGIIKRNPITSLDTKIRDLKNAIEDTKRQIQERRE